MWVEGPTTPPVVLWRRATTPPSDTSACYRGLAAAPTRTEARLEGGALRDVFFGEALSCDVTAAEPLC